MKKIILTTLIVFFNNVGVAQWAADSAVNNTVCAEAGQQNINHVVAYQHCLATDGAGGVIVVWQDTRNNAAIYAQRIDNNGTLKWNPVGIPIATRASNVWNVLEPCIVSDGKGGAIMVWERNAAGYGDSLFAQRVDANGTIKWAVNGVPVCVNGNTNQYPVICSDNNGGAIVAWQNDIAYQYTINAQRIDSNGVAQWTTDGVIVRTAGAYHYDPQICSDGKNGAIISWYSDNTYFPVFVQRIDGGGNLKWTPDGNPPSSANAIKVSAAPNYANIPRIISDGNGGAIVAWSQHPGNNLYNVYLQRVDSSGGFLWPAGGVNVCSQKSTDANIVSDGSGGAIVTWSDFRAATGWWNVYAQRITSAGLASWTADGIPIVNNSHIGSAIYPSIATDGNGGAFIAWADNRSGANHIYEQSVSSGGVVNWRTGGITISSYNLGFGPSAQQMISDGSNNSILVWEDARNSGATNLYAQRVLASSALPVELVSFTATSNRSTPELKWTTATETNNYGFEVERKQILSDPPLQGGSRAAGEAGGFQNVGFVQGAGTTNTTNDYSFLDVKLTPGEYVYRLKQIDRNGAFKYSQEAQVTIDAPKIFSLAQNYPDPFNPATTIEFTVPRDGRVTLKVYNLLGLEVATLFNGPAEAGKMYRSVFDASRLSSGVYFSRIEFGGNQLLKKMLLLK